MNMLAIDTSTQTMGVALMKKEKIVAETTLLSKNDHSSRLMPAIHELMGHAKMVPEELDTIVVTEGPGSYTGTRIGITTAKTLAWALDIPIKTVSSLKLIASSNSGEFNGLVCPFIDARRGMVYTGLYRNVQGELEKEKEEVNILFASWLDMLQEMNEPVLFLSNDIDIYKQQIEEACNNAVIPKSFNQQIHPSHLFTLAHDDLEKSVHEIVPNYLRRTEAETKWMEKQEQGQNSQQHSDGKQRRQNSQQQSGEKKYQDYVSLEQKHQDSQQHSGTRQHQDSQRYSDGKQHQDSWQNPKSNQYQHSQQNPKSRQHQRSPQQSNNHNNEDSVHG